MAILISVILFFIFILLFTDIHRMEIWEMINDWNYNNHKLKKIQDNTTKTTI